MPLTQAQKDSELIEYAKIGNTIKVIELIEDGANVNCVDRSYVGSTGLSPLMWATISNHVGVIRELFIRGANIDMTDDNRDTSLHYAALSDSNHIDRTESALALIELGANIHATNRFGSTPLHYAASYNRFEIVCKLIAGSADVNADTPQCLNTSTPLANAIHHRCEKVAVELIKHGANVNVEIKCAAESTPLHMAVFCNQLKVLPELLKHGADINAIGQRGKTPLQLAYDRQKVDAAATIIAYHPKLIFTVDPLFASDHPTLKDSLHKALLEKNNMTGDDNSDDKKLMILFGKAFAEAYQPVVGEYNAKVGLASENGAIMSAIGVYAAELLDKKVISAGDIFFKAPSLQSLMVQKILPILDEMLLNHAETEGTIAEITEATEAFIPEDTGIASEASEVSTIGQVIEG